MRRILVALLLVLFAVPAFANSITLTPSSAAGPYHGSSSWVIQYPGGYYFGTGTGGASLLTNGSESFQIFGAPYQTVSTTSGSVYYYTSGILSFSEGSNSWSGTLTNISFSRLNGVNLLSALFTGTENGTPIHGVFTQNLAFNNGSDGWSGGPLGSGQLVTAVPEPGSLMLMGTGLLGMAGMIRRKLALL